VHSGPIKKQKEQDRNRRQDTFIQLHKWIRRKGKRENGTDVKENKSNL
jgi:hypothetical protein